MNPAHSHTTELARDEKDPAVLWAEISRLRTALAERSSSPPPGVMSEAERLALALRELMEALPSGTFNIGDTDDQLAIARRLHDAKRRASEVLAAHAVGHPPARPRGLLEQYDREQLPGYRAGYEDGRLKGYAVGQRHASMQSQPPAQPAGGHGLEADVDELLLRFERDAQRFGELWARCQGKGWPKAESDEFDLIRDKRLPTLKSALRALAWGSGSALQARSLMSFDEREDLEQQLGISHQVIEAIEAACAARWHILSADSAHPGTPHTTEPDGEAHSRPSLPKC